jgi:hypothetical protein
VHFLAIEGLRMASGGLLQKAQSSSTVPEEDPAALQDFFPSTPEEVVLYPMTWTKMEGSKNEFSQPPLKMHWC